MKKYSEQLGTESMGKLLLKMSLPATVGMIVNALYNLVDTIFVGQGVGHEAIGGLAISFPIQMIIMAFSLMVGVGSASAISRSLGEGNQEKADIYAGNSYVLIIFLSLMWALIGLTFTTPILKLFGATDTLLPYARDYIRIIFMGSVFFSFTVSANNLIRAEGNAKVAMYSMLIGTGVNIILDPVFIFGFKMGIKGAAIATIIAQFLSFLFVMRYFYSGKSSLRILPHHMHFKIDYAKDIITVGMPAFVRNTIGSLVAMIVYNSLKVYGGDVAIIVYGTINRLMMFLFMPVFGIVQGLQPIIGYNYGMKAYDRVKHAIKLSTLTTIGMMTFATLMIIIIPTFFLKLFTSEQSVLIMGKTALRIIFAAIPVVSIQIIGATVYQALGKAKPAMVISLLRQVIFFIPLVLIMPAMGLGLTGIWLSFVLSDLGSTVISYFMIRKEILAMK